MLTQAVITDKPNLSN